MIEAGDRREPCVWPFQVAMREGRENLAPFLLLHLAKTYPVALAIGITPRMEKLYQALKWKCYPDLWRAVHPIELGRMAEDYRDRLKPWQRTALGASGVFYNAVWRVLEMLLASAPVPGPPQPEPGPLARKLELILPYAAGVQADRGRLQAVELYGVGRIVRDAAVPDGLRHHARLWRELRRRRAKFCEFLVASPEDRRRARWLGYVCLPLPLYYSDPGQRLGQWFGEYVRSGFTFLNTDKVL